VAVDAVLKDRSVRVRSAALADLEGADPGITGPAELIIGSCAGSRAGSCMLLTWGSVLVWHVGSRGQPAALHLDCPGRAAESGPGGPEAVRVILRLTGKAL
jgi:hypothetical protein